MYTSPSFNPGGTTLIYSQFFTLSFVYQLYSFFEDTDQVYLVLEMCHNGTLNDYIKTTQLQEYEGDAPLQFCVCITILNTNTVQRIFKQIVQGLLYLHSHQIVHRDLSLANLLLTKDMDAVSCIGY